MTLRRTDRSLPIALLRAREAVMAPVREMLAKSGISEQKWRVIRVLDEAGPMEQTALAREACLLLPSLTRMLRAMETEGLIARTEDSSDRRKSIVRLTRAGRHVLEDRAAESAEIAAALEARFGTARLETLLDLLEELSRHRR
ncbi:MAG: homoprotocatechuate degradation operon regulator HpaR [Pseudomonadota bacterium]